VKRRKPDSQRKLASACKDRFLARITVDGKVIRLGIFPTARDAAKAFNDAAKKFHGEFAYVNAV
jgi:hypothetical protein